MSIFSRAPLTWTLCLLVVLVSVYKGITTHDSDTALEVTNTIHIRGNSPRTATTTNVSDTNQMAASTISMLSPPMYLHGFTRDWRWGSATKVMSRGGQGISSSKAHWYSSDYKEPLQDVLGLVAPPPSLSPTQYQESGSTSTSDSSSFWDSMYAVVSRLFGLVSFPNKYVFTSLCAVRPGELLLSVALLLGSGSVLEVLFGNHNDVFIPLKYVPGWSSITATSYDHSLIDATRRVMVVPFLGSRQYRKVIGTVIVGGAVVFILGAVVMEGVLYVAPSSVNEAILVVLERVSIGPNASGTGWNWVLTPSPVFLALTIHLIRRLITLPVSVTSTEKPKQVVVGAHPSERHATITSLSMGGSHHLLRSVGGDSEGMGPSKSVSGSTANSGAHTPELGPLSSSSSSGPMRRTTAFITDAPWKVKLAHWLRNALPPPPPPPGHPSCTVTPSVSRSASRGRGGVCETICGGSSTMMAALLNPAERKVIGACGSVRVAMLCGVVPLCVDGSGAGTSSQHPLRTFAGRRPLPRSSEGHHDDAASDTEDQTPQPSLAGDAESGDDEENSGSARQDPAYIAMGGSPKFSIFAQSNSFVMDVIAVQLVWAYLQSTFIMTESNSHLIGVAAARLVLVVAGPVLVAYGIVGAISHLQLFGILTRSGKFFKLARHSCQQRDHQESVDLNYVQGGANTVITTPPTLPDISDLSSSDGDDHRYTQEHDRDSLLTNKGNNTTWAQLKRFSRRRVSRVRKVPYSPRTAKTYLRSCVAGFKQKLISKVRDGLFNALYFAVATPTALYDDSAHRHVTEMTLRPGIRKWVSEEWRGYLVAMGSFLQGASTTDARPPPLPPMPKKSELISAVHTTANGHHQNATVSGKSSSQQLSSQVLTPTALAYVDLVHRWDVGSIPIGAVGTITFKKHTTTQ